MSELRVNPITGGKVIIATERSRRPEDFPRPPAADRSNPANCPFCPGNERETPLETMARAHPERMPDQPGWLLRVVPNKYPALTMESAAPVSRGMYQSGPVSGLHEVIIHSPDHFASLAELEPAAVLLVMDAYRDRYLAHHAQPEVACVQIILNYGGGSGASLAHSHSQVFAIPFVHPALEKELKRARAWRREQDSCIFCDLVAQELKRERMVYSNPRFAAFCAYAPRYPCETWVVPRGHTPYFEDIDDEELGHLGEALYNVLGAMYRGLGDPPYNLYLHTSPCARKTGYYHWHFEILPRLANWGGFELASGVVIGTVLPEEAARFLRDNL
jgi:UDPglucose--hexose-1-phosphate uridylyltransferase